MVNPVSLTTWRGIVDVCLVIKQRLEELGLEQKDLASRRRSYRVLYFPAADSEEIAPGA